MLEYLAQETIDFAQLKAQFKEIRAQAFSRSTDTSSLQERLVSAYQQKIIDKFQDMMEHKQADIDQLTSALAENWALVKGTYLDYTSIPNTDITIFLANVASFCAKTKKSDDKSAFNLLMPGLHPEANRSLSMDNETLELPDLNKQALEKTLKTHVTIHKGKGIYPIIALATQLCPANLEETPDNINLYWDSSNTDPDNCQIMEISEEDKQAVYQHSSFTRAYHAFYLKRQDLRKKPISLYDALINLSSALEMNNKYHRGTETNAADGAYPAIISFNEYYRKVNGSFALCDLTAEEVSHIQKYVEKNTSLNKEFVDKIKTLNADKEAYRQETFQLREVEMIETILIENNQNALYNKLVKARTKELSRELRNEIDLLITLSTDSTKNEDATSNIETCIATRGNHISSHIPENKAHLESIGVSDEALKKIARDLDDDLKKSAKNIKKSIEENIYQSDQTFRINKEIFNKLNVEITINTHGDLNEFLKLSAPEMKNFLENNSVREQIIKKISTLDVLIAEICGLESERLIVFISYLKKEIINKFIKDPKRTYQNLTAILLNLDSKKINDVLNSLGNITEMIKNEVELAKMLNTLSIDRANAVLESIKNQLHYFFKDQIQETNLLNTLNRDKKDIVKKIIENKNIDSLREVEEILEQVETNNLSETEETDLKIKLNRIIKNKNDLSRMICLLKKEDRTKLLDFMKEEIPSLIKNTTSLSELFYDLKNNEFLTEKTQLLNHIQNKLPTLITTRLELCQVLSSLLGNDKNMLYNHLYQHIMKFSSVYRAMIAGTNSLSACFPITDLFNQKCKDYSVIYFFTFLDKNPNSLLATAWRIYSDTQSNLPLEKNIPLQFSLYQASFKHSFFGARSNYICTNAAEATAQDFENAPKGSRRHKIHMALL